jgi:hypothetical protein
VSGGSITLGEVPRTQKVSDCSPWIRWRALNPPNRRGTDPYARWCGRC